MSTFLLQKYDFISQLHHSYAKGPFCMMHLSHIDHTCQPLETQMREISLIWSLQWGRFCVNTIRDLFSVINNLFTFYSHIYPPYSPIILTKYQEHCWNSDILISKLHMLQYFLSYRASMLSVISQSGTFSHLQHGISRCIVNTGNILFCFVVRRELMCPLKVLTWTLFEFFWP